ncbi:MAG: sugar transferase [Microthrixaceae bacterium]|jgi:lipopolysaccharide/colanic/teichoic acid biosynthesis glycosyltransferase
MRGIRAARLAFMVGTLVVVAVLSKYHAAVVADPPYDFTASFRLPAAFAFVALLLIAGYGAGLPDRARERRDAVMLGVGVPVVAAIGVSIVQLALGSQVLPRFVVGGSVLLLAPWYVLCANLATDLSNRTRDAERVLVVGDLADVGAVVHDIDAQPERPVTLVDVCTPDQMLPTAKRRPLIDAVVEGDVTLVVLDATAQREPRLLRQVARVHERGVRVRSLLDFYEEWLGKLPVSELERQSLMFDIAEIHGTGYASARRLLDLAVATVLGIGLVVMLPVVAVANLFGNRGPLFFSQDRVGKGGTTFRMLKFRTMRPPSAPAPAPASAPASASASASESAESEATSSAWTSELDPRVTPFGRVLRVTHLDELPQVINILRGELSVVGPRPEQPHYVEELTGKLPFYSMRHLVRPGLTGWAQVKYGYAGSQADALEKLQYEFYQLRHQSIRFDLVVMIRTIRAVFGGAGRGR